MIWLMMKYDELCDVVVSNHGLVTAKEIDVLGVHLKDVLVCGMRKLPSTSVREISV